MSAACSDLSLATHVAHVAHAAPAAPWHRLAGLGLFAAVVLSCAFAAGAADVKHGPLVVSAPYARATVPGQPAGGGYLGVRNTGKTADRLVSARADVARSTELHTMSMDGDVMRMREVDGIDLPAGKTVELKPGGLHLMFMGLKAPLKVGDRFPLTLTFAKAGAVTVTVDVQSTTTPPAAGAKGHAGQDDHDHDDHDHDH